MPPKKDKIREERLIKQRLCQRRRYANIKNDPQLLEIEREKRRQKYLKKKEKNQKVEKTPRTIKEQRKKWRENSKRYRQRKKEGKQPTFEAVQIDAVNNGQHSDAYFNQTVRLPDANLNNQDDPLQINSEAVKKAINQIKYKEMKKRKMFLKIFALYKKKNAAQAKKIFRLQKLLKHYKQISKTDSNSESESKPSTSTPNDKDEVEISSNTIKLKKLSVIESIKTFYLQDANSVFCAGKKQYITKNKIQMQKRYLCLPLKELHQKFLNETKIRVSYSFFCKLRPFWVVFPKNSNRDTCQCQVHENMKLLIEALHKNSVIKEKTYYEVLAKLCCDLKNITCLQRNCGICRMNRLEYCVDSKNSECTFYEWKRIVKEVTLSNGKKKKRIITQNIQNNLSTKDVIIKFEKDLKKFFEHTLKIVNQYNEMKRLKENLNIHEACIHVDFSENYSLKYGTEVQSFHFGASRQQVSLHTAVVYTHSFSTGQITPNSMCTISDCLRHDAPAIWAHLIPLIDMVIKINPFIDTIHFLSDSPSSQYRNKYVFYIISQLYKDYSQIKKVTWNYSEAGHGKGAPDGVGATLKRTADRMVNFGKNVGTYEQFCDLMKKYMQEEDSKIQVMKVEKEDVIFRENLIPKNLKSFRGTFSVYQVLWEITAPKVTLRDLSCFDCEVADICVHGKHLGFIENVDNLENQRIFPTTFRSTVTTLGDLKSDGKKTKKNRINILSDITINKTNLTEPSSSKQLIFYNIPN